MIDQIGDQQSVAASDRPDQSQKIKGRVRFAEYRRIAFTLHAFINLNLVESVFWRCGCGAMAANSRRCCLSPPISAPYFAVIDADMQHDKTVLTR